MRIVVTGREGQIVRSLLERGRSAGDDIIPLGRPDLDLAADPASITRIIEAARPEIVVSAAAYTAVDKAEEERDLAFAVNERGAGAVARATLQIDVPLIHISTDYVFDGSKDIAYVEEDLARPTGAYGASKLAGERAIAFTQPNSAILRTAWVYSPFGTNFVKTMLRLAADRDEVSVVADQRGNPTNAMDIADGILAVARNLAAGDTPVHRGIFHMTGDGDASWADFAEAIFEVSAKRGGPSALIKRVTSAEYPTVAKRPANSRLNSGKLEAAHGVRLPNWRNSIESTIDRLVAAG